MSRLLLIGGLGHTDLSGKVSSPGLLMLRNALRRKGHNAVVANYSTSLMGKMFPQAQVSTLSAIYERSLKPLIIEGKNPLRRFWQIPRLIRDMKQIETTTQELFDIERGVFEELGSEVADRLRSENFDAVGFSMYLGSSSTGAIIMADIVRKLIPNIPIFFGGPQTTHFAETILRHTQSPTALVQGPGELSIVELANIVGELKAGNFVNLNDVPNIIFRAEDGTITSTARHRLSYDEWLKISAVPYEPGDFEGVMRYAFIETSRGCFYNCHFCSQPLLSGATRDLKPATDIVGEMVNLHNRFGIAHFELVGSSTPPKQAEEIAQEILSRGLDNMFSWILFMRGKDERSNTGHSIEQVTKIMKQAGASAIFFGVEAADNATLKKMGKGEKIEDIERAMLAAKAAGIATIGSFIYPYPGMPANEDSLILDFLRRVLPLSAPVQALGLLPGTYDAEHANEIGCEIIYPNPEDQAAYLGAQKPEPTMKSRELLDYLLTYRLILSLPMKLWPPLPYKIDGRSFKQFVGATSKLQKEIARLGILLGFSHSHHLISQVLGMPPSELSERMFYCALTGDPEETNRLINLFNK